MAAYDKCVVNPSEEQAVEAEMEKGGSFGVEGTPAFFVNGIPLGGAQPFEAFEALVKAELKN
jgi:protein-disulfide isomerase